MLNNTESSIYSVSSMVVFMSDIDIFIPRDKYTPLVVRHLIVPADMSRARQVDAIKTISLSLSLSLLHSVLCLSPAQYVS